MVEYLLGDDTTLNSPSTLDRSEVSTVSGYIGGVLLSHPLLLRIVVVGVVVVIGSSIETFNEDSTISEAG